VKREVRKP